MYTFAVEFMNSYRIHEISPIHLTPLDFLEYFYYGGICFVATEQYEKAIDSFYQVLDFPGHATISAVMIAAYSKAVLVSLIHTGHTIKSNK
jgi:COP9 signalosome complex subunit 3